jgi:hypothetical protein
MIARLLNLIPKREIGWKELEEHFTRYTLCKTPWFRIYLHRLNAPIWHAMAHDHPWSFITLILKTGYWESTPKGIFFRSPGTILYRPASFAHNVVTLGTAWSLVFAGRKKRDWGFVGKGFVE